MFRRRLFGECVGLLDCQLPNGFRITRSYSVIITTFDRDGLAQQAIKSALVQRLRPNEVIVIVDGGPPAFSRKLKAEFSGEPVTVFEQPNYGTALARNSGIALAKSEFVAFLDDDDLWHFDKLVAVDHYLDEHPECEAVNHPVWWFAQSAEGPKCAYGFRRDFVARNAAECHQAVSAGDPSENSFDYLKIQGRSFEQLLIKNCGTLTGAVIRRGLLITAGCFSPMHSLEDWTTFMNIARLTEWHTIPRRLAFCRLHSGQATSDPSNGVYALAALANTWLTGRPAPERIPFGEVFVRLARFGREYRRLVQLVRWEALRRRDWRTARRASALGRLLLPRLRDRLYAAVPPPITWRFERYLLGMHK